MINATEPSVVSAPAAPDITLLLARLEKQILEGAGLDECRRILGRRDLWSQADVNTQLRWARLAQMAGDVETALNVFARINARVPDQTAAWTEHLELLALLDRRDAFIRVFAAAKGHVDATALKSLAALIQSKPASKPAQDEILEADEPFRQAKTRAGLIAHYLDLFSGRQDCFARQWADKAAGQQGYVPVRQPLTPAHVEEHLRGRKTYGIYILRADATVKAAVIDMDLKASLRGHALTAEQKELIRRERRFAIQRIGELAGKIGFTPLVEFSGGKGFHFWFLLSEPTAAGPIKATLEKIRATAAGELTAFDLEVFPKQSSLSGKGLGNLVKLPLGIHRQTGRQSFFVACPNREPMAQLAFLSRVQASAVGRLQLDAIETSARVIAHPRRQQWIDQYPELGLLEERCLPLAQALAACRGGQSLSVREEKVLFQTVGFLPRAKTLLHHLAAFDPEYNPHLVDFKLSRLKGTPLGCRRIHSLLTYAGDYCLFKDGRPYDHPLLHLPQWREGEASPAEKIDHLEDALDNLRAAMDKVRRFLPKTP